jgi:hypothetical protein
MKLNKTQPWRRERGSALLLTLLLTLVGGAFLGLTVDAVSLIWVRSNAQTSANLVAASLAVEKAQNPGASAPYLLESARATAAWNGYRHGVDSVSVQIEEHDGRTSVLLEKDAGIYFLRMFRREPIAVRARAFLEGPTLHATAK